MLYFQNGYEYRASTKAFYRTFNPECHDETTADQEVVDVILSGKVITAFSMPPRTVPPIHLFPDRIPPSTCMGKL
jgi:hypothetical protein